MRVVFPVPDANEWLALHARQREWDYQVEDLLLTERFHGDPFGTGSHRKAKDVVRAEHDGRAMVAFQYEHATRDSDGDRRWHRHAVVALHLGVRTPDLSVRPTGLFDGIADWFGSKDIAVGNPAFDQAYRVTSPSPEFALDVLHPGVVAEILQWRPVAWRFEGDSMLTVAPGGLAIEHVDAMLQFMDTIVDRVPEFVWDRLRGEAPR